MNNISNTAWRIITPLFAVVVAIIVLGGITTQPWHVLPELGGDGGKNVFTFLYHSIYGKGMHFQGMNYPYGEHIVYTDAQPVLSVPLSYLKGYINIPIALSIMWWTTSIGFVLGIIFTARILRHYNVPNALSLLFAALIMTGSPQLLRISGHFALAFSAVIPMLFWFTLQYHETHKLKYPFFIFLTGCFAAFMHPYFSAVTLIWCTVYIVATLLAGKGSFKTRILQAIAPMVAAAMVLAVFGMVMKLTDNITDRPAVPYGVLDHITHIKDIFSSGYSPFWAFIKEHSSFSKISYGGEGYTYFGLAVWCTLLVAGYMALRKRKTAGALPAQFSAIWLIMAVMGLLLGGGAPFTWGMSWLLDYASALRQFRTLGRFSWIAYYIVTVYGAVLICHWHSMLASTGKRNPAMGLVVVALSLWSIEAVGYIGHAHTVVKQGYTNYNTFTSQGEQSWTQFLAANGCKPTDFQAIIVLPFFATGSEKLWVSSNQDITDWSIAMGVKAGMQLQLPMMDIMMSRSGWGQTFAQVKTAGGPYTNKPALALAANNSNKPLLLLHTDDAPLNPDQQFLINHSQHIGHFLHCEVYRCDPRRILTDCDSLWNIAETIGKQLTGTDTCVNYSGSWFVDHMDAYNYNNTPFGTGAKPATMQQTDILCEIPVIADTTHNFDYAYKARSTIFEFSCWFHVPGNDYRSPKCILELLDAKGRAIDTVSASTIESTDNQTAAPVNDKNEVDAFSHNLWLRCNAYFPIDSSVKHVRCRILNFAEHPFLAVDELMIRPANALIISKGMANNHLLVKERYR